MNAYTGQLHGDVMRRALAALGVELGDGHSVEILVVGGAAGLLTGVLPPVITTGDVDAVYFRPPGDVDEVLRAADVVAARQRIAKGWLNIDAGLYANAIPDGWEARRVDVGCFGRLQVYALGRLDLIATKFYAHRGVDLEHLQRLNVTSEDCRSVEKYLRRLLAKLPDERGRIDMALRIVEDWPR